MDFNESLAYLLSLGHETLTIKLGLRNTELLLAALGNPQHAFSSIQIAGTNGKGSTAALLDSICRRAHIRTGLFTSPHLISITERISVAGNELSPEEFAVYATQVRSAADGLVEQQKLQTLPTFFEHVTAIALLAFKAAGIELAILETGLGGRLDATTVSQAGVVAITPIALDHQEYLGETLVEIAAEKAAIIRRGVSAVIAPQLPEAMAVILKRCAECEVEPVMAAKPFIESVTADGRFVVSFQTATRQYESIKIGLRGRHQIVNAATAISVAEQLDERGHLVSKSAIVDGIKTATHQGRLENCGSYLFDGAHNPAAAQTLRNYLDEFVKVPVTLLFGAMRDKNLKEMATILFPAASRIVLTQPENPRAATIAQLQELAREIGAANVSVTLSVREGLIKANEVTSPSGLICVTGSLYLLGEVKTILAARDFSLANDSKGAH